MFPNQLRKIALEMIYKAKSGHIGGSFSIAELITYLYNTYEFKDDVLILSKDHAVPIIYAALHIKGIITKEELLTFREVNSRLQGHPVHTLIPQVYATTGSLGQGLSIAIGHAHAKKVFNLPGQVFCIIGDGELQEGQIWESLVFLNRYPLDNLTVFIDKNKGQNDGETLDFPNLSYILNEFKFNFYDIDEANNINSYEYYLKELPNKRGKVLLLHTQKGAGVSFMSSPEWHGRIPTEDEYKRAIYELSN